MTLITGERVKVFPGPADRASTIERIKIIRGLPDIKR
jgi:hypothetical protein